MSENKRQHIRIEKHLTLHFCIVDEHPQKWDMSVIQNISVGGVMFIAPADLKLNGMTVALRIQIPELAPHTFQVEAIVLSTKLRLNKISFEVRAKFINLTPADKNRLSVLEKMINQEQIKNAKNADSKKLLDGH